MTEKEYFTLVQDVGNINSEEEAKRAVEAVIKSIREVLIAKDFVHFKNFGVFELSDLIEKICIVPGTEKNYDRHAFSTLRLKFDKTLKIKVNGG